MPVESVFDPLQGAHIRGTSTAERLYYAAVIPGAVIAQGYIPVSGGKFDLFFDPKSVNDRVSTYDIAHRVTGKPEIGDVVHLTLFSEERSPNGVRTHSFARVIIRGTRIICTR
jgi:hypothetical protein